MAEVQAPKSEALRALYWRSEILQVMFWLRGEGFGDLVDPPLVERFLGVDADVGISYLDRLVDEGYLARDGTFYTLSERGLREGSMEFALAFDDLMRPTHGECSADCWCHMSAEEADACVAQRHNHDHDGDGDGDEEGENS